MISFLLHGQELPRETGRIIKRSSGVINIVECGFLTNPDEAALLQSEEYQEKVANAVADGIGTYLEKQEVPEKN